MTVEQQQPNIYKMLAERDLTIESYKLEVESLTNQLATLQQINAAGQEAIERLNAENEALRGQASDTPVDAPEDPQSPQTALTSIPGGKP